MTEDVNTRLLSKGVNNAETQSLAKPYSAGQTTCLVFLCLNLAAIYGTVSQEDSYLEGYGTLSFVVNAVFQGLHSRSLHAEDSTYCNKSNGLLLIQAILASLSIYFLMRTKENSNLEKMESFALVNAGAMGANFIAASMAKLCYHTKIWAVGSDAGETQQELGLIGFGEKKNSN